MFLLDPQMLRIFKAVVDQGGFGHGAEACHVTQSAASQSVRRLEEMVGARLLVRGRPPRPTHIGKRVYEHAREVLARDARLQLEVESIRQGGVGTLRLGASQALSRQLLPELVAGFQQELPRAGLHLETLPSRELIRVVGEGALELGLGPLARAMAGFDVDRLATQRMLLCCGGSHPHLRRLRRRGEESLREIPLVTSHLDSPEARPGGGRLRELFATVWEVHSLDLRVELVRRSLAVGYLPESILESTRRRSDIVPLTWLRFGAIERDVGLYRVASRPLTDAAEVFVRVATANVRSQPEEAP